MNKIPVTIITYFCKSIFQDFYTFGVITKGGVHDGSEMRTILDSKLSNEMEYATTISVHVEEIKYLDYETIVEYLTCLEKPINANMNIYRITYHQNIRTPAPARSEDKHAYIMERTRENANEIAESYINFDGEITNVEMVKENTIPKDALCINFVGNCNIPITKES